MFEMYGPVLKTTDMGRVTYLTNDPAIAQIALSESPFFTKNINKDHPLFGIKDDKAGIFLGDTDSPNWEIAHRFMPPAFTPKAVRHYTPLMQHTIEKAFPVFDELDERGEVFNVYQYMLKLGSQAIGKFALSMDLHHFDSVDAPLHRLVQVFAEHLALNKKVTSRGDWYAHLPFGDPKRLNEVRHEVNGIIEDAATHCERGGTEDLPIEDAALNAACVVDYATRCVDRQGNKIPHDNLIDILMVVTGAGFTTTSSLLSWLVYCCVTYPDMQDRILQELVDHDINEETEFNSDLIGSLHFLDKFVKETQRLHNPSYQPGRTTRLDCILPGGYRIPAEGVIIVGLHHIHNNPDVWDNPHKFNPDRWEAESVKKRHACAYIPFAHGKRMCIGFNFALQEVKVFLPKLIYRYRFERKDDQTVEYDPMFQLIRPLNHYVRATRRTTWPAKSSFSTNGGSENAGSNTDV